MAAPPAIDALREQALRALQAGQPHVALAAAARWCELEPRSAVARNVLGIACRQSGRLADAIARLTEAVGLAPDFFDARVNLGNALLDAGDADGALPHYRHALSLEPRAPSVHNNLGNLHRELRQPAEALACYRQALALEPRHANAWNNVGNVLKDLGDAEGALDAFRRSLALAPNRADVWSNYLFTLNVSDRASAEQIAEEHRAYGRRFAPLLPPLPAAEGPRADGRLKVGYVSSDFRRHAVATFFAPLLEAHDRSRVEVFCYYNGWRADDVTSRLEAHAEHFVPVSGIPDRALAERIRRDGIDVLVDLNGHTADNRLPLFFLRPAPVQATWLGYLAPTGVPTIDWRITDPHADPIRAAGPPQGAEPPPGERREATLGGKYTGASEAPGLERPWRLPRTMWCYRPYAEAPGIAAPPHVATGFVTFGCLNNPGKVSPTMLDAWAQLLRAVPASRLVLLTSPHPARVADVAAHFARAGIAPDRIEQVARAPLADYLQRYAQIDVALDTWPYNGGTTSCDALWMGVPVVTLATERPFARSGASILAQLDLGELVAATPARYVAIARALAADRERLARLRSSLRTRMAASALTDAAAFARDFEAALAAMRDAQFGASP